MARELKYNSQFTDLDALQRELGAADSGSHGAAAAVDEPDDTDDEYEDWTGTGR